MVLRVSMLGLAALAAAALFQPAAQAQPQAGGVRAVDCELTVGGKTRHKGICEYRPLADGGFQISGGDYFAYVNLVKAGLADASWNADPAAAHADTPIGRLKRKGACWEGKGARICARDLTPAQAKAYAALPRGATLYPEVAPNACLGTDGPLAAGRAVTLRSCKSLADRIFAVAADGTIGLEGQPGLCLAAGAQLTIEACSPRSAKWSIAGGDAAAVRSSDGRCLAIPQLEEPDAKFPFRVTAQPCAEAPVKFLVERE
ncbi:MAG: ricin-type beta-trefoil lectin domain protein [Sphingomonas sp.]